MGQESSIPNSNQKILCQETTLLMRPAMPKEASYFFAVLPGLGAWVEMGLDQPWQGHVRCLYSGWDGVAFGACVQGEGLTPPPPGLRLSAALPPSFLVPQVHQ